MGGREGSRHTALVFRHQASRECEAPIPVGGFEIKRREVGRSGACYNLRSKIQVCVGDLGLLSRRHAVYLSLKAV